MRRSRTAILVEDGLSQVEVGGGGKARTALVALRLLWACALLVSVAVVAYLGYRTLCDSRDNPTVLSLESVPVQDVPFPAVSFHPHSPSLMMKPSAKHLEDRVLRSLEFDCTMRDARCMEMSSKLRKDLGWAIRHMAKNSWSSLRGFAPQYLMSTFLCSKLFTSLTSSNEGWEATKALLNFLGAREGSEEAHKNMELKDEGLVTLMREIHFAPPQYAAKIVHKWVNEERDKDNATNTTSVEISSGPDSCVVTEDVFSRGALPMAALVASGVRSVGTVPADGYLRSFTESKNNFRVIDQFVKFQEKIGSALDSVLPDREQGARKTYGARDFFNFLGKADYDLSKPPVTKLRYDQGRRRWDAPCMGFLLPQYFEMMGERNHKIFCSQHLDDDCCQMIRALEFSYADIFRYIGASLPPFTTMSQGASTKESVRRAALASGYKTTEENQGFRKPIILACKLSSRRRDLSEDCGPLQVTYGSSGAVLSHNRAPNGLTFRGHGANEAFERLVAEVEDGAYPEVRMSRSSNGFSFDALVTTEKDLETRVLVHGAREVPNFSAGGGSLQLKPGKSYDIQVTPSMESTSQEVLDLTVEQRKCLAPWERELGTFRNYSQSNCILDCAIRSAYSRCGCIPWDFPHFSPGIPVCSVLRTMCFKAALTDPNDGHHSTDDGEGEEEEDKGDEGDQQCDCPADCDSVKYEFKVQESDLRLDKDVCGLGWLRENLGFTRWYRTNETFQACLNTLGGEEEEGDPQGHVARIKVFIRDKTVTNIKRSRRVTMAGLVANIGGLVGLFTGISFLSLFEALLWLLGFLGIRLGKPLKVGIFETKSQIATNEHLAKW